MDKMQKKGSVGLGAVLLVLVLTAAVARAEDFGSIAGGGADYSGGGGAAQESAGPVNFQTAGQAMQDSSGSSDTLQLSGEESERDLQTLGKTSFNEGEYNAAVGYLPEKRI
jgi:hypothetical protein